MVKRANESASDGVMTGTGSPTEPVGDTNQSASSSSSSVTLPEVSERRLPRLLDLGSDTCIPCKMMAPILDQLRADFDGEMDVEFINVRKEPAAATAYSVVLIPTQIFIDRDGRILARHEGFMSREDILTTWKQFGYSFDVDGEAQTAASQQTAESGQDVERHFEVLYLHPTLRCHDCLVAEENIERAVNAQFAGELESGYVGWRSIDYEMEENRELTDRFEMSDRSELVLVLYRGSAIESWESLPGMLEIGQDEAAAAAWIVDMFDAFEQANLDAPPPLDDEGI
ncbi:MAG: thioredoxin [Planctomycetes bacterium]|nr:thioredoxin [Planctomycetota bacterium]NOG55934.1 thioredoxin family protein [Planctomycetota bacterium]